MCRLNSLVLFDLVLFLIKQPRWISMCNPAAERSEAKSESEFREAKVKCIQSQPFLLFYLLNASQLSFREVNLDLVVCAEPPLINDDAQSGRRMIVQSDIILCDMAIALGHREETLLQLC